MNTIRINRRFTTFLVKRELNNGKFIHRISGVKTKSKVMAVHYRSPKAGKTSETLLTQSRIVYVRLETPDIR